MPSRNHPTRPVEPLGPPPSSVASRRLRLRARWHGAALTRELADGRDPGASPELTLVARELIGTPTRRRLADALDRLLHEAAEGPRPRSNRMPLNRDGILAARAELAGLAEGLRAGVPAPVHAVALAAVLVRDGTSPIYDRRATPAVALLAREARRGLDDPIGRLPA